MALFGIQKRESPLQQIDVASVHTLTHSYLILSFTFHINNRWKNHKLGLSLFE